MTSLLVLLAIGALLSAVLWCVQLVTRKQASENDAAVREAIDALLPQTQCGQCGHPGCAPYAAAIEQGEAINRCPPGGQQTVDAIAKLLDVPTQPLVSSEAANSNATSSQPQANEKQGSSRHDTGARDIDAEPSQTVVVIREEDCIGCTKCIEVCPVDAIVGANRFTHTVIESEWTGCNLCIPPCPVDCIDIVNSNAPVTNTSVPSTALSAPLIIASDRHKGTLASNAYSHGDGHPG